MWNKDGDDNEKSVVDYTRFRDSFKYFTGDSSDYSSSSKKVVNDNGTDKELTYRGNGDYVDNYGDSWHSDDDGKTAYKK